MAAPGESSVLSPVQRAYVQVLRVLADGHRDAAVTAATALEAGQRTTDGAPDTERLVREYAVVMKSLARRNGEALVPVMLLHHDLSFAYYRRGDFRLSGNASALADAAARLYAAAAPGETVKRLTCDMFVSFGAEAQRLGALVDARGRFGQALNEDPKCEPALLGLGSTLEVIGHYGEATALFGRANSLDPDNAEAALRFGVNLARVGKTEQAIEALEARWRAGQPEWVAVVAAEELGRVLVGQGRLREAEAVLRGAVERFPAEGGLVVALAHVLDLERERGEARHVLYRLDDIRPGGGESPRYRYTKWPSAQLLAARDAFVGAAEERLTTLRDALDAVAP